MMDRDEIGQSLMCALMFREYIYATSNNNARDIFEYILIKQDNN
jgi:hypothetical protein